MTGHVPVLLRETVDALNVRVGGVYVDGTLGRAGHAAEILKRGGTVLGIDRDEQAVAEVETRKAAALAAGEDHYARLTVCPGCHGELAEIARMKGWGEVDGILLDLGVSSPQLDEAGRGFSFRADGPLDMRMGRAGGITAAEIVNARDESELTGIFREYGEEPAARRIAKAIVRERSREAFATTRQLAGCIERTIGRHGPHHPATRVFQALRMVVNDEIDELERALQAGLALLKPGGRFAVITFESLTDRRVKRFFAEHAGKMVSLQQGGERWEGVEPKVRLVFRRACTATESEKNLNPRSRSAKLRVVERM